MAEPSTCKTKLPQEQIDLMISELLAGLKASIHRLDEACSSCLKTAVYMPPADCECRGVSIECKKIEKDLFDLNKLCTGGAKTFCLTVEYINTDEGLTGSNRALFHDFINGIGELFMRLPFAKRFWRTQLPFLWTIVGREVTDAQWSTSEVLLDGGRWVHVASLGRWRWEEASIVSSPYCAACCAP